MGSDFDVFLDAAWDDHGDDPQGVLDRLPAGLPLATTGVQFLGWVGLTAHVTGHHLGRWDEGIALLDGVAEAPQLAAEQVRAVRRSQALLRLASGDRAAADALLAANPDAARPPASALVRVLIGAASALVGQRQTERATTLMDEALAAADYGPAGDDPAARALAASCNNIAMELEEVPDRDLEDTALMLRAARQARTWWEVAGTPTNVMLAEVRVAASLLAAGQSDAALVRAHTAASLSEAPETLAGHRLQALLVLGNAQLAAGALAAARAGLAEVQAVLDRVPPEYQGIYGPQVDALSASVS